MINKSLNSQCSKLSVGTSSGLRKHARTSASSLKLSKAVHGVGGLGKAVAVVARGRSVALFAPQSLEVLASRGPPQQLATCQGQLHKGQTGGEQQTLTLLNLRLCLQSLQRSL